MQTAALRSAEAADATNPVERERLHAEAAQGRALAETLTARAEELQAVDDARARWLAHTAGTRAAAERARAELGARHVDDTEPEQQVTAEHWLAAHHADAVAEDPHRAITDADLHADVDEPRAAVAESDDDVSDDGRDGHEVPGRDHVEVPATDVREIAAAEPPPVEEDVMRVPSAADTARAIEDANRALVEMRAREATDAQADAEQRATVLTRWHTDDVTESAQTEQGSDLDEVDAVHAGYDPASA